MTRRDETRRNEDDDELCDKGLGGKVGEMVHIQALFGPVYVHSYAVLVKIGFYV